MGADRHHFWLQNTFHQPFQLPYPPTCQTRIPGSKTASMPAIPVYTASPLNAATADGQTPQTAQPGEQPSQQPASASATTTSTPVQSGYPAPQPGARPTQPPPPAPTGLAQDQTSFQPTPTQSLPVDGPPPPQPGAAPVPPTSHLPPPPKVGEKLQHPPPTTASALPPQMSYPAPTSQYAAGKSTTTAHLPPGPTPTSLYAGGGDHPPGYRQDVHASDMSSAQRAAHEASVRDNSNVFETGDDEGVWGTMKKWGTTVGNNLAAAENEVWKRINKD